MARTKKTSNKLRKIIFYYFFASILIIATVIFVITTTSFYQVLKTNTREKLEQSTLSKAQSMTEWFSLAKLLALQNSQQHSVEQSLLDYYNFAISLEDLEIFTFNQVNKFLLSAPIITGLVRLDKNNKTIGSFGREINLELYPKEDFINLCPILKASVNQQGQLLLILATPIIDKHRNLIGKDIALIDTDPLQKMIVARQGIDNKANIYLIQKKIAENSVQVTAYLESNFQLQIIAEKNLPRVVFEASTQENISPTFFASSKTESVVTASIKELDGWSINLVIQNKDLYDNVIKIITFNILLFLVALLITLAILWFAILRPLAGKVMMAGAELEDKISQKTTELSQELEERKKTEKSLALANNRAKVAQESKSQFLANLSHEFKTPMNIIIGMTDLTLLSNLNDDQHEYLGLVKSSSEKLLTLINSLLDLSKLDTDNLSYNPHYFNLFETAKLLAEKFTPLAEAKNLTFNLNFKTSDKLNFYSDSSRLKQILAILLDNAIKFTEKGTVDFTISSQANSKQNHELVTFTINDTGLGIEEKYLDEIYQPFFQKDLSPTRTHGGAGLGLAIAIKFIELMAGEIILKSKIGVGSTFIVNLSLEKSSEKNLKANKYFNNADLEGKNALIIEEDTSSQLILNNFLKQFQATPLLTNNVATALKIIEKKPKEKFDLLFLSYNIFIESGMKLAEKINAIQNFKVPFIILKNINDNLDKEQYKTLENQIISLIKPLQQQNMLKAINKAWSNYKITPSTNKDDNNEKILTRAIKPKKIILIEDNILNQKLTTTLLKKRGHQVVIAENGQIALDILEKEDDFDLALMDIQMPIMDGLTAVKKIRKKEDISKKHLPIIAMTAHAFPGDKEKFLDAGMDDYLAKPFKLEELIEIVETQFFSPTKGAPVMYPELNKEEILDRFMDDQDLLFDSINIFTVRAKELLSDLKKGVENKNAKTINVDAHTLKGMVGLFSTASIFQSAGILEQMGHDEMLSGVEEEFARFTKLLNSLIEALEEWRSE